MIQGGLRGFPAVQGKVPAFRDTELELIVFGFCCDICNSAVDANIADDCTTLRQSMNFVAA